MLETHEYDPLRAVGLSNFSKLHLLGLSLRLALMLAALTLLDEKIVTDK